MINIASAGFGVSNTTFQSALTAIDAASATPQTPAGTTAALGTARNALVEANTQLEHATEALATCQTARDAASSQVKMYQIATGVAAAVAVIAGVVAVRARASAR